MIKKSSRYGNKSLNISTVNLAGRAYNPRYYIIGKMSKRMLAICLNVIAKELEEENFTVWCLPKDDFPTIFANKVMSISWNEQKEKDEVKYLNVIAKELEEENFTVWCLPKDDFPTIFANKVMSISWNEQKEKDEVKYYTEMLNDILKKIKRSNLRIVSPEHNQKVVMFENKKK